MISEKVTVHQKNTAFTLIELLVVISIIALLMSILMPALTRARTLAKMVICSANQKTIVLAATAYQAGNGGKYPRSFGMDEGDTPPVGVWPNPITKDFDDPRDNKAYTDGEKITDYLGDSVTFDTLVCPMTKLTKKRRELSKGYYYSGESAYLSSSYAYYWNYASRSKTGDKTFVGPGIRAGRNSKLLTSDLCVFSIPHYKQWFVPHPPEKRGVTRYTGFILYGFTWEVPWPDETTLYPVKINAGSTDGSVVKVDSEDMVTVDLAYRYGDLFISVPSWAAQSR